MTVKKIELQTKLRTFKSARVKINIKGELAEDKVKKLARITVSKLNTSKKIGFMHAVLISIGPEYFLLAGPSGIGKSTLAERIVKEVKGEILANDWVAVERERGQFYASDLNFEDSIKHFKRCRINGVIFITQKDQLNRDAYVPNKEEYTTLINQSLDDMSEEDRQKIGYFWKQNIVSLPFYCALSRKRGIKHTTDSLIVVLKRLRPKDTPLDVGIIGVGSVGVTLAHELSKYPLVQKVHLYNRSNAKASGIAIDLNQALLRERDDIFVAHDSEEDLFRRSSIIFLTFREAKAKGVAKLPERWRKVESHIDIVKHYAEVATRVGFTGTIFMVTNPVDFLTYSYYQLSQKMKGLHQRTFQMYGVGLEADIARAVFYGRKYSPNISASDVLIYGNHADFFTLNMPLEPDELREVKEQVVGASNEVRSHDIRTVFGPVAAACRSFEAFIYDGSTHISVISNKSYIGCKINFKFSLPMIVPKVDNPSIRDESIVYGNKQWIKEYKSLL